VGLIFIKNHHLFMSTSNHNLLKDGGNEVGGIIYDEEQK
jgi:hypothetical protein